MKLLLPAVVILLVLGGIYYFANSKGLVANPINKDTMTYGSSDGEPASYPASKVNVSFDPSALTMHKGEQKTVDVVVDSTTLNVTAVDLKLSFDPSLVRVVGIAKGPALTTELQKGKVTNSTASIILGVEPGQTVSGKAVVAKVTIKALNTPVSSSPVTISQDTQITAKDQTLNVLGTITPLQVTIQ